MCHTTLFRCQTCTTTRPLFLRCEFFIGDVSPLQCSRLHGSSGLAPAPEGTMEICAHCIEKEDEVERLRRMLHNTLPSPRSRRSLIVDTAEAEREARVEELRRQLHSLLWSELEKEVLRDGDGSMEAGTPVDLAGEDEREVQFIRESSSSDFSASSGSLGFLEEGNVQEEEEAEDADDESSDADADAEEDEERARAVYHEPGHRVNREGASQSPLPSANASQDDEDAESDHSPASLINNPYTTSHPAPDPPTHRRTISGTSLHATGLVFQRAEQVDIPPPRPSRQTRERRVTFQEVGAAEPLRLVSSSETGESEDERKGEQERREREGGSFGRRVRRRLGRVWHR